MANISLIMKVTSNCSLACSYCDYRSHLSNSNYNLTMSKEILYKSISQLMLLPLQTVEFIWHGGEPLLAGKDFFERIIYFQKKSLKKDQKVINCVQTNATFIDQEWIDFFKENNFSVGISFDGPIEIHNAHRSYSSGKGSFVDIMKAVELLRANKIQFGLLTVLTKDSLKKITEIYDFFISNNFKELDFLFCVEINRDTGKVIKSSVIASEYATFMIQLFDLWIKDDDPDIRIRYFDNILTGLLGGKPTLCKFAGTCSDYLTIDCNGDIYPCDNFVGYNELKFGNILDDNLQTIINGDKYKEFMEKVSSINSECLNCEWHQICQGGCPYYRYMFMQDFSNENYFCKGSKEIFKHIEERVKEIIR